ncbi:MAG: aryl-sulfate sulfotransferase [Acidobacteriota bacterium]|nr:MAG: aryl-sulfate sulfotransferase [Acidobacteriota bacterium]
MKTRVLRLAKSALAILAVSMGACSDRTPPGIVAIELVPNDNVKAPLAAKLRMTTDEPTRLAFEIDDGQRRWTVSPDGDDCPLGIDHEAPVLGLHAAREHSIVVVATDAAGNETRSEPFEITTPSPPELFPDFEVVVREPERMEPGFTFFNLRAMPEEGSVSDYGVLVAVDDTGEVVWLFNTDHDITDARHLKNGNVLYESSRRGNAYEIDMLGNVVRQWHTTGIPKTDVPERSIPLETDAIHHEILEMPSGNLLALSAELREFEDYPTSEEDADAPRAKSTVVGDVLIEFTRDGTIVEEIPLLDVLDPYRIGFASLDGGYWKEAYKDRTTEDLRDWSHTNAVFYDEKDDAFVVSARRQDAVYKVTRDGELVWILGNHDNWREPWSRKLLTPRGELDWFYHQHAPKVTPQGTILLFDNRTYGASPFTGQKPVPAEENYSRAVEYEIDEESMEARQVWSYGGKDAERFYSQYIGDADWLPRTGNILVTDGGKYTDADGNPVSSPGTLRWARVVEVTHTTPPEKVFELHITDEPPMGFHVYRADRIPTLYPE